MKGAKKGDGDPLDICVISERAIAKSEVILNARVIGGIPMIDNGEADDKIIAVLNKEVRSGPYYPSSCGYSRTLNSFFFNI